jgi:hypothetical protein
MIEWKDGELVFKKMVAGLGLMVTDSDSAITFDLAPHYRSLLDRLEREADLRDRCPALQSAWEHYQIALKMAAHPLDGGGD